MENLDALKAEVAERFGASQLADALTLDELAGFPHWLFFAARADVEELKRHLELERKEKKE